MTQDNHQLREELVQSTNELRADTQGVRKEMKALRKESMGVLRKDRNRLWDLSWDVSGLGKQLAEMSAHMQNLQRR